MRYLLYSHDGFGLGHTRRHLAIARALTRLDMHASVLLASGSEEAHRFGMPPRVEILKLPALRKVSNGQYVARRLNIPPEEVLELRSELLLSSLETYRPSVVLVDKHPFGVCGEFRAALATARSFGARTALGLRDILDEPATVLQEWAGHRDEIPGLFDAILIYGMQAVFDPIVAYRFNRDMALRTRFCGYVINQEETIPSAETIDRQDSRPLVVATAGGGEDGFRLLDVFLRASIRASWRAFAVAGPMMPDAQYSALQRVATKAGATLNRFVPNIHHLFRGTDVLVCMGGYNTLVEAVATRVATICIPRVTPRREQSLRASAFEKLGLVDAVAPGDSTPNLLRKRIESALKKSREKVSRNGHHVLQFDGAMQAARHLRDLTQGRKRNGALHATSVV